MRSVAQIWSVQVNPRLDFVKTNCHFSPEFTPLLTGISLPSMNCIAICEQDFLNLCSNSQKKYGWFSFKDACFRSFQTSDSFFRRRYKIPFRWLMISHFLWIYHVFLVAVLFSTPNFFFEFWRTHLILLVIEAKALKTLLGVEAQTIKTSSVSRLKHLRPLCCRRMCE